jgi:predicted acyl esterase
VSALTPGVPVLARVELSKLSFAFRRGSRIRIWIDTPSATGENAFDHLTIPVTNSVWHDTAHPSRLVLGEVTQVVQVPPERGACNAVLMQPCRTDPLR